jgi:phosphoglucomutase
MVTGETTSIEIPKSNVLIYTTEDGTIMAARPSGTEPKIKFYFSINATLDKASDFKKVDAQLDDKINRILKELNLN